MFFIPDEYWYPILSKRGAREMHEIYIGLNLKSLKTRLDSIGELCALYLHAQLQLLKVDWKLTFSHICIERSLECGYMANND